MFPTPEPNKTSSRLTSPVLRTQEERVFFMLANLEVERAKPQDVMTKLLIQLGPIFFFSKLEPRTSQLKQKSRYNFPSYYFFLIKKHFLALRYVYVLWSVDRLLVLPCESKTCVYSNKIWSMWRSLQDWVHLFRCRPYGRYIWQVSSTAIVYYARWLSKVWDLT